LAILFDALLALFGTVFALWVTGTSLNVVSFLGAIIGVGVVAKNGILVLDEVERLSAEGWSLDEALVRAGRRRPRPVLMTSMAAALGQSPSYLKETFSFARYASILPSLICRSKAPTSAILRSLSEDAALAIAAEAAFSHESELVPTSSTTL
jgi:hypothetical protein